MSHLNDASQSGQLPPVPPGMSRREYRQYLAQQGFNADGSRTGDRSQVSDISHFTADVANVAQQAAQRARDAHRAQLGLAQENTAPVVQAPTRAPLSREAATHFSAATQAPPAPQVPAPQVSAPQVSAPQAPVAPAAPVAPQVAAPVSPVRPTRRAGQTRQSARLDVVPNLGRAAARRGRAAKAPSPTTNELQAVTPHALVDAPVASGVQAGDGQAVSVPPMPTPQHQDSAQLSESAQQYLAESNVWYDGGTSSNVIPLRRDRSRGRGRKPSLLPAALTSGKMLPKVGMVGALGVASVVAPLLALNSSGSGKDSSTTVAMEQSMVNKSEQPQEPVQADEAPANETLQLRKKPVAQQNSAVELEGAAKADAAELANLRAEAERASRDFDRDLIPGCNPSGVSIGGANGRLASDDMCRLPWAKRHVLRADAAVAFAKLNEAYMRQFGDSITLTDSYRSYAQQVSVRRRKPALAAVPGTSQHGWGLAVDIADGVNERNDRYYWLRKNAPRYGWDNPPWARQGGSGKYEPWHWEFNAPHG